MMTSSLIVPVFGFRTLAQIDSSAASQRGSAELFGLALVALIVGPPLRERALMVLISNIQLYAGIVRPSPEARVDDGLLNVCIFKGRGFAYMASHFISIALGQAAQNPQLINLRSRHIRISAKRPTAVHVDAEPIGFTPINVQVVPQALRVIVPQSAPAALFSN